MSDTPASFHEFSSRTAAAKFRQNTGCGGWIFATSNGEATLFPVSMTPSQIFTHRLTAGCSGVLV